MYTSFLNNKYKGVSGVTVIDSGKKGLNIAILAITHGNEVVGLSIFDNLINKIDLGNKLLKGKIYLIAINILAYKNFINQEDHNMYRFVNDNMNRINGKKYKSSSYEFKRKKELEPIFDELDIILDIHSVPKGENFICISNEKDRELSKKIFDVETILLDDISNSGALIGYVTAKGKIGFGLECGNHTSQSGFKNGLVNTLNLLGHYRVIDKKYTNKKKKYSAVVYQFIKEIFPKSKSFKYSNDFVNFTPILPGIVFGIDGKTKYKNTYNKTVYIGFIKKNIILNDGCGFLFKKIE